MGLKPRPAAAHDNRIDGGASQDRTALVRELLEGLKPTAGKGAPAPTTSSLERQFGFVLGAEMRALSDTLRGQSVDRSLEVFQPAALSLTEVLKEEADFVVGYLSAFFSGATPFANMYHDMLYSVSWAQSASGNQKVCVWNWDEGWGGPESASVAAFVHDRLVTDIEDGEVEGEEPAPLPSPAAKEAPLPTFLDSPKLWSRSHWLVYALYHSGYGDDWAYPYVAKPSDFAKEAPHFGNWPHLVGHWLWWSLFFDDEAKLAVCLQAARRHAHPFVRESAKLIDDFRAGKTQAFEDVVSLEQTRDTLREHVPSYFPKVAKKARTARAAQTKRQAGNARKVLAARLKESGDDPVLSQLDGLIADKTFGFTWVAGIDYMTTRDAEELYGEPYVDQHFSTETISKETYERVRFLRAHVTAEHRPVLLEILEILGQAKRHRPSSGLVVDLVARTCKSYDDMVGVMSGALGSTPSADMSAEVTYAARLFPKSPAARKQLFDRARKFVKALHGGKLPSSRGFTGLFQCDTKETARVLAQLIEECANYTLHDWPWRAVVAALKRARSLEHGALCANACRQALKLRANHYGAEQALFSLMSVDPSPAKHKEFLREQYEEILDWASPWSEYRPAQRGLRLAGALYFRPGHRPLQDEAKKIIQFYVERKKELRLDYVSAVHGLAMVAEANQIKQLYPVVKTIKNWRGTSFRYGESPRAIQLAMELTRRRAARIVG